MSTIDQVDSWESDRVRVVAVKDLKPGMRVLNGKSVWKVELNLGYRLFHQPKLEVGPKWDHIILFRRKDPLEDEVSFVWAFRNSDVTVDVWE